MQVPHEVPLGPRIFVDRLTECAQLADVLTVQPGGAVVVGVCSGLPGVGKTALVRRVVEQVRSRGGFVDGDLHVDFGATADGIPVAVADALGSCLAGLGVNRDVLPGPVTERANLLRSLTAIRSVLIVLDDVTDPAQVLPFIPRAASSAVLVTSTNRLDELVLDGGERVEVPPLAVEDAERLMAVLCGPRAEAEPAAVTDLVGLCAGLPVALKVAAAQLVARPHLRVADLVARIGDERMGLAPFAARGAAKVVAVFAVSYHALPEPAARLYRLLGALPVAALDSELVAVLAGGDPAVVSAGLDLLVESGLVTEDAEGRWSMHPLVRRHAVHAGQEYDSDVERRAALSRVVDFMLVRASFADRAVLGRGRYRVADHDRVLAGYPDPFTGEGARSAALAWLDRERAALMSVLRVAFAEGWHDRVWLLAEAMTALYVERRYLVDWTEACGLGADAARQAGSTLAEARLGSFSSRAWTDLGDLDRAAAELDRALPMAEATGDMRLVASVWELIGRLRDDTDLDRAPEAYQRAIDLFTEERDVRGVAFTSYFLGCSLLRSGRIGAAVTTIEQALVGIRKVGDKRMQGRGLTSLGEALTQLPDLPAARDALDTAIKVLVGIGNVFYEALAQERRAEVALLADDRATARGCLSRAWELHLGLGSPRADEISNRLSQLGDRERG